MKLATPYYLNVRKIKYTHNKKPVRVWISITDEKYNGSIEESEAIRKREAYYNLMSKVDKLNKQDFRTIEIKESE